ncbi:hypothetical protein OH77DRAFT_1588418 [Trametes cingulata]|nr:hypothetical protein OH77DRAFT_1588418 [Trametes cingulata]
MASVLVNNIANLPCGLATPATNVVDGARHSLETYDVDALKDGSFALPETDPGDDLLLRLKFVQVTAPPGSNGVLDIPTGPQPGVLLGMLASLEAEVDSFLAELRNPTQAEDIGSTSASVDALDAKGLSAPAHPVPPAVPYIAPLTPRRRPHSSSGTGSTFAHFASMPEDPSYYNNPNLRFTVVPRASLNARGRYTSFSRTAPVEGSTEGPLSSIARLALEEHFKLRG